MMLSAAVGGGRRRLLRHVAAPRHEHCRFVSFKVAIVGSGPSGCYTAKYLVSALVKHQQQQGESTDDAHVLQVDILERLPTPYGLVRYGVAPDHAHVKNVQNDFDALFDDSGKNSNNGSNRSSIIHFFGNVEVGVDVSIAELRERYDAVVMAYGCQADRRLPCLPGQEEFASSILSAREFVAWYNGHPDFVHIGERVARALKVPADATLSATSMDDVRHARRVVVIGQGNVALDCARILLKGSRHLYDTDIASHSLGVLGGGVGHVSVVGRRGHVQGAFTIKELRELTKLQEDGFEASFHVRREELDLGMTEASQQELDAGRPKKRIHKLLYDASEKTNNQCRRPQTFGSSFSVESGAV